MIWFSFVPPLCRTAFLCILIAFDLRMIVCEEVKTRLMKENDGRKKNADLVLNRKCHGG